MLFASLAFCLVSLQGQGSGLPHTDFSKDLGGWASIAETGKVSLSRDVLMGKSLGSLKFEYDVAKGRMDALMMAVDSAPLGKMKSLRFWVRPDYDTTFGVFLQEVDGGRYVAVASARKEFWQLVELSPSDFVLSDGLDDPADPNGKLDLSLVQGIGIADMKQFFAQAGEELISLFGVKMGPHTFYLSDFMAAETPVPDSMAKSDAGITLDTLVRPQVSWVSAGTASLSIVRDGPLVGKTLKMEYSVGPTSMAAMFRAFAPGALDGTRQIEFSLATTAPCTLMVQLEERSGGKYNSMVPSLGGSTAKRIVIPYAEFDRAQDSNDPNDTLDLADVKQILILDVTGLMEAREQKNTLWLGPVMARAGS